MTFYANGQPKFSIDSASGWYTHYYNDGKPQMIGNFKAIEDHNWVYYDTQGRHVKDEVYAHQKLYGETLYYYWPDGSKALVTYMSLKYENQDYHSDIKHIIEQYFYPDQRMSAEIRYLGDSLVSTFYFTNEGEKITREQWESDYLKAFTNQVK